MLPPVQLSVMSNRLDSICREMTNTMLLTARSSVLGVARDFSVSIVTSDDEVLAAAEGIPLHVWGSNLQTACMRRNHPDFKEGDAYIHNDPRTHVILLGCKCKVGSKLTLTLTLNTHPKS